MKVYGDLTVQGDPASLENFVVVLERFLTNGWSRYREPEARVRRAALGPMYCFRCTARDSRPASELWMATDSDGNLYVSNIRAQDFPSLTYDQYNAVLADFYTHCAKPAADAAGVNIDLGNPDPQLEDFMSSETAKLLRSFSREANRSVFHPLDRRRWNEFLASAYREGAKLPPELLQRWLVEEEKWPEDEAINLAMEFEHARDLLETFEAQQA
jgi:hypothetical protein